MYYITLATFPPEGRERCSPVHKGLRLSAPVAVRLARRDARRINAEGDDHGKTPAQRPGRDARPKRQQRRK